MELVIGLVGAVGSDLKSVCEFLRDELADVQYESHVVRLRAYPSRPAARHVMIAHARCSMPR